MSLSQECDLLEHGPPVDLGAELVSYSPTSDSGFLVEFSQLQFAVDSLLIHYLVQSLQMVQWVAPTHVARVVYDLNSS